jgi:hypothetical protein
MNFLTDLYFTIKWKIEDALFAIKDKFNNEQYAPFVGEEYVEETEVKPKKKKAKKKTKNKSKK